MHLHPSRTLSTLLIFTGISVMAPSITPATATVPWTLEQALTTAVENSPDAALALHRIEAADALIRQARAMTQPQVMLRGGYTQTDSPMMAFGSILNQRAFNFGLDFNNPGTIDNLNATAMIAYPLYTGGRGSAGIAAAKAGARAAGMDERATRQQLQFEVVTAYLSIHKAHETTGALEAGTRAYDAAVAAARARFDAGQLLKADLLSLEVQLAHTRENLLAANHGRALAERAFLMLLGIEPTMEAVEITPEDPALARIRMPAILDGAARPELLGLRERIAAAESMVQAAQGGRRPSVNAFASYGYDHGWKLDEGADSWTAGVAVEFNIFDGGAVSGRIQQARAELAQVRSVLRRATLGIAFEIEQARLSHALALERTQVTALALAQATESAELSRARFTEGALLAADLIGIESRLIEAQMRRAVALADERIALAALRRAVGETPLAPLH